MSGLSMGWGLTAVDKAANWRGSEGLTIVLKVDNMIEVLWGPRSAQVVQSASAENEFDKKSRETICVCVIAEKIFLCYKNSFLN